MSCRARSWFKVRIRRGLDPKLRIVQIWYAVIWDDSIYFWLFGYRIFLMNHVMISFHFKWFFNVEMQEKPFKNSEMVLSIKLSSWQARKRKVREKECHLHFPLGFFDIYILLAKPMSFLMLVHFFVQKTFRRIGSRKFLWNYFIALGSTWHWNIQVLHKVKLFLKKKTKNE